VDSALVTATAAGLGSLIGATASITTTWIAQRTQSVRAYAEWRQRERETLFKEFITEASRLAIDAVINSMQGPESIMKLYGVLSCIRLVSGQEVVRQGEACCRRIVEQYGRPNLTTDQLRDVVAADRVDELDPLDAFSNACRIELLAGQTIL
jgi:uncharacterized protein YbjQ (UPF0145 family)